MLHSLFFSLLALAAPGDVLRVEPLPGVTNIEAGRARFCPDLQHVAPAASLLRFKVTYETTGPENETLSATGLVMIPQGLSTAPPLLSYQHGTIMQRSESPSRLSGESLFVAYCMASLGIAAAMPDYLGLGDSLLPFHPYHHARTQGSAAADLLAAMKQAHERLGFQPGSKLFLAGYSQGGHATMAALRTLENRGIAVTAAAPMSGAYDLSGSFFGLLDSTERNSVAEVALAVYTMDRVYHVFSRLEQAFRAEYAPEIPALFDGYHSWRDVFAKLPATPREALQPAFIAALRADPNHPFLAAIRENDLYDWKPLAPVRFYFGSADKEVPPENSRKAYARMKELGAPVSFEEFPGKDHSTTFQPAVTKAALWFRSLY